MAQQDPLREMRTMILASLPYPPLPVTAQRLDEDGRVGDEAVITTHDVVARWLNECAVLDDQAENQRRKERQVELFRRFLHGMAVTGFDMPPRNLYLLYTSFCREHIATYDPAGNVPDLRFKPYDYVCRGDKVHAKLCEYMAAQAILFNDPEPRKTAEDYARLDLGQILLACRDRIGHIMTDEEKVLADRVEAEEGKQEVHEI